MKLFNDIKSRYYEFLDYLDESEEVFVNRKNQIVAIVEMINPFQFIFYKIFFKLTKEVIPTKDDYFRLYPKEAEHVIFDIPKYDYDETWTLGYMLRN